LEASVDMARIVINVILIGSLFPATNIVVDCSVLKKILHNVLFKHRMNLYVWLNRFMRRWNPNGNGGFITEQCIS